ncbi:MAG TPA: 3'-5' exonuclease [Gemmatimonadaceae bacterium]|jgi:DNA polymerase-3 subunit epsilon
MDLSDLRSLSYAVVDVETTGTRVHGGDRIMEVAVVHVRDGIATTAAEFLVNPQRPVSPWVSRLTGITWETVHEAPTFGDIAERIQESIDGHVFVAHNVRFDWRFLSMELQRATGRGLRGRRLCTVKFARKLLPYLRRRNLDALAWHYDVPIIGRHRAGGDARATARILQHMFVEARRQDVDTWNQLETLLRTPKPPPVRSYLPQPVRDEAVA